MDLICRVPNEMKASHILVAALRSCGQFAKIEECASLEGLASQLRTPPSTSRLAFIALISPEDVRKALALLQGFAGTPMVLLMGLQPPEMLSLAHRLRPRLLAPLDTDIDDLMEVVANLVERNEEMEGKGSWPRKASHQSPTSRTFRSRVKAST